MVREPRAPGNFPGKVGSAAAAAAAVKKARPKKSGRKIRGCGSQGTQAWGPVGLVVSD